MRENFKQRIMEALESYVKRLQTADSAKISGLIQLTVPPMPHLGDYATSLPLQLAKMLKKPPLAICPTSGGYLSFRAENGSYEGWVVENIAPRGTMSCDGVPSEAALCDCDNQKPVLLSYEKNTFLSILHNFTPTLPPICRYVWPRAAPSSPLRP